LPRLTINGQLGLKGRSKVKQKQRATMEDDPDDILGQLTYVIESIESVEKETIVAVAKAAIAEILELRIIARSSRT
jgi:hypothetical protein